MRTRVEMSDLGLNAFDKTIQLTHVWLKDVGETIGPDKQRQYHALRAVLFALRDRIPVEEAFHLSAQMPMLVRGIFWESYNPAHKPETYRSKDEFLEAIEGGLQVSPPLDPRRVRPRCLHRDYAADPAGRGGRGQAGAARARTRALPLRVSEPCSAP